MASPETNRRNALARERGFRNYSEQRKFGREVKNRADIAKLPPRAQQARQQSLDALAVARRKGIDLTEAAREVKVSPEVVRFWVGDAASRSKGRLQPSTSDRLFRPMYVYSAGRTEQVDVRGSGVASTIGRYHAGVQHYLKTGDDSRLTPLRGVRVGGFELETDLDVLDELARRGAFDFESIYRMVN